MPPSPDELDDHPDTLDDLFNLSEAPERDADLEDWDDVDVEEVDVDGLTGVEELED